MLTLFWRLLGWRRYDFGSNRLWLRGARLEELPNVRELLTSGEVERVLLNLDIHD